MTLKPIAIAVLLCVGTAAQATGAKTPPPPPYVPLAPTYNIPVDNTVNNKLNNELQATSKASSALTQTQTLSSHSSASAGSDATSAANAQAGGATIGGIGNGNAWSLSIAPPVFTPPMAAISGCSAQVTQQAMSVGWGFFSQASGTTDVSDCTLIAIRNEKVENCQYASAKQIEDLMLKRKLPDFVPSNVEMIDLTPKECHDIKHPPPPPPVIQVIYPPAPVPPKEEPKCEAPKPHHKPTLIKKVKKAICK
jgi:hypothetical protein